MLQFVPQIRTQHRYAAAAVSNGTIKSLKQIGIGLVLFNPMPDFNNREREREREREAMGNSGR